MINLSLILKHNLNAELTLNQGEDIENQRNLNNKVKSNDTDPFDLQSKIK